jgi:mRNA interferase RelE/StbE
MQIIFLKVFSKDLDKIKNKQISKSLLDVISEIRKAENIREINNLVKLEGYKNAYRIRIGEYRLGTFIEGNTVELARFLPRKDIYKYFPK